ncbi:MULTISPECIES: hypothetical protein [Xanthomonas]|uniref:hypothetical protein n=1 Tax=Xanthomonas TaxID=338 RepID=UPI00111873B7|nr:hypothetical protein [Xanthomonas phaseoli]MBO9768781.1 hypothetical protein [Xanthomonas phaseoli pv. dieffenbachiae]MBO9774168.1 hypothetical protein [Xanthomonas phaseoli pv. dieffenbachiae]MBO9780260.1 hypothetical protein [Xanthomonas phaseoli pv. dieffenbachiae]MBO9789388.1 hypothetical protein [Xanthomonas phaseoli pv. dieffenbachiae]MBO9795950.1 hypothetical protein [Xanthomonas phaseoli pv. dieffenbachiae]
MKSNFVLVVLVLLAGAASAAEPQSTCSKWALQIAGGDAEACSDLCPQAAAFDHYNYRQGLSAAFGSEKGLTRFLGYLQRSSIIGAGAEAHACSVSALLEHWGDQAFARHLSTQSPTVREKAIGLIDYTALPNFKARYPKTYRARRSGVGG